MLLSLLGIGKVIAQGCAQWLSKRSLAEIACIILSIACAILIVANKAEKRHSAKLQTALVKCTEGRAADRKAYTQAQLDAAGKNKAHVADVEAQQKRITDDVEAQYRADLARLRAERGKLQPANSADKRPANGASSPAPSNAPGGPNCEALPLPADDLLHAQETELQLNALIDWVLDQSNVDPNKP